MAELKSKCGSFSIGLGAAASTVSVSGLGFRPMALIFWWTGRTESVNTAGSATSLFGFGYACTTSNQGSDTYGNCAVTSRDEDALGTADSFRAHYNNYCIAEVNASALVGAASLTATDSDSFTLTIQDQFVTNLTVSYMAYGGEALSGDNAVVIGDFAGSGTAPTTQTVSVSNNPTVVFIASAGLVGVLPQTGVDSTLAFGFVAPANNAAGSSTSVCWYGGQNDAATSGATGTYYRIDTTGVGGEAFAVAANNPTSAPTDRADIIPGTGQIGVSWKERSNAQRISYMSIAGGAWSLRLIQTQTNTTAFTASFNNTPDKSSVKPKSAFVFGAGVTNATDATPTAHQKVSIGAWDGTTQTAQFMASRNANTTMFTMTAISTDSVYINMDPTTDAIIGLGQINNVNGENLTFQMSDADPSNTHMAILIAGDPIPVFLPPQPLLPGPKNRLRR